MDTLIELGITGITLAMFLSLVNMASVFVGGGMEHTGKLIAGMQEYQANPSDENRAIFESRVAESDDYVKYITSVSGGALLGVRDIIGSFALQGGEKASFTQAIAALLAATGTDFTIMAQGG